MNPREDDSLNRAYREASDDQPPSAIDAAIRAAAAAAVADAASKAPARSWQRRWGAPMAMAASVVLGLGVVLRVALERPDLRPQGDVAMAPAPVPAPPSSADAAKPAGVARNLPAPEVISPQRAQSVEPERRATEEVMAKRAAVAAGDSRQQERKRDVPVGERQERMARAGPEAARAELPPVAKAAPPAVAAAPMAAPMAAEPMPARAASGGAAVGATAPAPAPAPGPAPVAALPERPAQARAAMPFPASPAAAAPPAKERQESMADAARGADARRDQVASAPAADLRRAAPEVPAAPAANEAPRPGAYKSAAAPAAIALPVPADEATLTPEAWIRRIVEWRQAGRTAEADASLERFARRFPDYRVPPEARARPR
jgi:hypothetical protein